MLLVYKYKPIIYKKKSNLLRVIIYIIIAIIIYIIGEI